MSSYQLSVSSEQSMTQRFNFGVLSSLVFFFISSCGLLPQEEEVPTLMPEEYIPTAIALTAQALVAEGGAQAEEAPALESSPTPPSPTPGAAATVEVPSPAPDAAAPDTPPSPTAVPDSAPEKTLPNPLPYGDIQFLSPGPLSKIASPIQLHAYLSPGNEGRVWVALFGEDGRLLLRDTFILFTSGRYRTHLIEDLVFEIQGTAETARLEITTYDEYGRISALATQDLVLLSAGTSDVNLPEDLYEGIVIQQPAPSRLIQGGNLVVTGVTRHAPEGKLQVDIVDAEGTVIASQVIWVSEEELSEGYKPYAGEIPYEIEKPIWVRVLVSARDGEMSGVAHVSSTVVLLSP